MIDELSSELSLAKVTIQRLELELENSAHAVESMQKAHEVNKVAHEHSLEEVTEHTTDIVMKLQSEATQAHEGLISKHNKEREHFAATIRTLQENAKEIKKITAEEKENIFTNVAGLTEKQDELYKQLETLQQRYSEAQCNIENMQIELSSKTKENTSAKQQIEELESLLAVEKRETEESSTKILELEEQVRLREFYNYVSITAVLFSI